jgi:hypothetical protein
MLKDTDRRVGSLRTAANVAVVGLGYWGPNLLRVLLEQTEIRPDSNSSVTKAVGSKKMVVYEDSGGEAIKVYDRGVDYKDPETFGEYQLSYRTGDILAPKLSNEEPLGLQLGDFLRSVRTSHPKANTLGLARDVVLMAESADRSLSVGGTQVVLDDDAVLADTG